MEYQRNGNGGPANERTRKKRTSENPKEGKWNISEMVTVKILIVWFNAYPSNERIEKHWDLL